jgi:cytoskeletal protein RodZ
VRMGVGRSVSDGATRQWLRDLGAKLRRVRLEHDVSQRELADRTRIPRYTLSRAETGCFNGPTDGPRKRRTPEGLRVGQLRAIAVALAVPLSDLLPEEE